MANLSISEWFLVYLTSFHHCIMLYEFKNKVEVFFFLFESFIIFSLILTLLYIFPLPIGPDSWFHLKYSYLMSHATHYPFTWLPFTIYDDHYPDHHYGFHLLLSLFSFSSNLENNAVVWLGYQLLFLFFSVVVCVRELTRKNAHFLSIPIVLLLLGMSPIYNFRIFMIRAHVLGVCFLALYLVSLLKNNKSGVFLSALTATLYFNLQSLYILMFLFLFMITTKETKKVQLYLISCTIFGEVVGILLHFNTLETVNHIIFYLLKKSLNPASIIVGSEWYTLPVLLYLRQISMCLVALYLINYLSPKNSLVFTNRIFINLVITFLLAMSFQSVRHLEVLVPITFIFGISGLIDWLHIQGKRCYKIYFIIIVIFVFMMTMNTTQRNTGTSFKAKYRLIKPAAEWLFDNCKPGDIVVNLDWGHFPLLFANNHKCSYAWGLDPKYLYYSDLDKFKIVYDFEKNAFNGSDALRRFESKYLYVNLSNKDAYNKLLSDNNLKLCYQDIYSAIFTLKNKL